MSKAPTPADCVRWPDVPAEHLDAVLRAAGPRILPALAVLCSAIGWHLARGCVGTLAPRLHGSIGIYIVRAVELHAPPRGQG